VTPSSSVPDPVAQAAARLAPAPVVAIEEVRKGGNSRVFKVTSAAGDFALKKYPAGGERDRQGAEARALEFFARTGIGQTPRLVGLDPDGRMSLITWIDGTAIAGPADDDIEQFAAFQIALDRAIDEAARAQIGAAAEACVSGERILSHIRVRHARLAAAADQIPGLSDFLAARFEPALARSEDQARRIYASLRLDFAADRPQAGQTLIASDFGTHNALRAADGRLSFVDFEYFGWDDPLTSIGNFILHPGMQLTPAQQQRYRNALLAHFGDAHDRRLPALLPLYALRWCAIILSDLLPERLAHRTAASAPLGHRDDIRAQQLAKAERLLAQIDRVDD